MLWVVFLFCALVIFLLAIVYFSIFGLHAGSILLVIIGICIWAFTPASRDEHVGASPVVHTYQATAYNKQILDGGLLRVSKPVYPTITPPTSRENTLLINVTNNSAATIYRIQFKCSVDVATHYENMENWRRKEEALYYYLGVLAPGESETITLTSNSNANLDRDLLKVYEGGVDVSTLACKPTEVDTDARQSLVALGSDAPSTQVAASYRTELVYKQTGSYNFDRRVKFVMSGKMANGSPIPLRSIDFSCYGKSGVIASGNLKFDQPVQPGERRAFQVATIENGVVDGGDYRSEQQLRHSVCAITDYQF